MAPNGAISLLQIHKLIKACRRKDSQGKEASGWEKSPPRDRCPHLLPRRERRAPDPSLRQVRCRPRGPYSGVGPACTPAVQGRPWLPGAPDGVFDSQPKSCPSGRSVKQAQVAGGLRGRTGGLYRSRWLVGRAPWPHFTGAPWSPLGGTFANPTC